MFENVMHLRERDVERKGPSIPREKKVLASWCLSAEDEWQNKRQALITEHKELLLELHRFCEEELKFFDEQMHPFFQTKYQEACQKYLKAQQIRAMQLSEQASMKRGGRKEQLPEDMRRHIGAFL